MALAFRPFATKLVPTSPLKIDQAHPLAHGLIGCWVPGVSGGINLVGDSPNLTMGSGAKFGVGIEGTGLTSDASNGGMTTIVGTSSPFTTWTQCSLYWRGYKNAAAVDNADYISIEYDNGIGAPYELAAIYAGDLGSGLRLAWNTGGVATAGANVVIAAGLHSFGASFKVGGNAVLYQSGVATQTNGFGAGAPASSATSSTTIGFRAGSTGLIVNATCFVGYCWNRELTAAEMVLLDADPYGFLIPGEGEMLVAVTADVWPPPGATGNPVRVQSTLRF